MNWVLARVVLFSFTDGMMRVWLEPWRLLRVAHQYTRLVRCMLFAAYGMCGRSGLRSAPPISCGPCRRIKTGFTEDITVGPGLNCWPGGDCGTAYVLPSEPERDWCSRPSLSLESYSNILLRYREVALAQATAAGTCSTTSTTTVTVAQQSDISWKARLIAYFSHLLPLLCHKEKQDLFFFSLSRKTYCVC